MAQLVLLGWSRCLRTGGYDLLGRRRTSKNLGKRIPCARNCRSVGLVGVTPARTWQRFARCRTGSHRLARKKMNANPHAIGTLRSNNRFVRDKFRMALRSTHFASQPER